MRKTYLDNGSTSFPKAPGVGKAMNYFIEEIGWSFWETRTSVIKICFSQKLMTWQRKYMTRGVSFADCFILAMKDTSYLRPVLHIV